MSRKPNVVLVMTDDQGYADLGCTGNPWLKTPNIDRHYGEAVRCSDFHVSPLCTPTRGALMTGHYPLRNGAWATCWGRSILRRDETTMADIFAASDYRTGMFGKWHLGDNYPYRPQDRGFQTVVAHKGGGVGQTPDFWGNNYFDDTYLHNGRPVDHTGYCTDIWFDEAMRFIEDNQEQPFFCYISTNAPHTPYLVADRYTAPYANEDAIPEPAFYGMIANIDENFGKLVDHLDRLGLTEDTILIFMTDNGTSGGWSEESGRGYNAGMRGIKASYYDGGHRAPFFIRWPNGGIQGGKDMDELINHIDLLPTFIDLCNLDAPANLAFDGVSAAGLLLGRQQALPERTIFVQYRQDTAPPRKWENAVMTNRWRLVYGRELYDIKADPGQRDDVAAQHPDVVDRLRGDHERWWQEIEPVLDQYCPISLGNDAENPTRLDSMDVMGDVAWHQGHVTIAQKSTGRWTVDVEKPGVYRFSLRRWPAELNLPLDAEISADEADELAPYMGGGFVCRTINPTDVLFKLFDQEHRITVEPDGAEVMIELELSQTGVTQLEAWFIEASGEMQGAYYVYVERLTNSV